MKAKFLSLLLVLVASVAQADNTVQSFSSLVGPIKAEPVAKAEVYDVPFLFWGGDVATFVANGGLQTKPDSIYGKLGVKFNLVPGDDFIQQVRNVKGGKTPWLRCTYPQACMAAEYFGEDASTKIVCLGQLTWSAGDHMVIRDKAHVDAASGKAVLDVRSTLNNLKGKTVCLQQGGPHIGFLDDALKAANLKWSDIKVIWVKDLSGPNGPADAMRKDPTIDIACVITPDMFGLCSSPDDVGTGGETTVLGAHVMVSTAQMTRSIPDLYFCRADYYKDNKATVDKFLAGFLKGAEALVEAKVAYNDGKGSSPAYISYLTMAQQIYGEKNLPTIEVDAHGLVSDATFVGVAGNESFFDDSGNLNGFDSKLKAGLDLVGTLGYTKARMGFDHGHTNWSDIAKLANITYTPSQKAAPRIRAEAIDVRPDAQLDDKTLVSFDINFAAEQEAFNPDVYASDFQQVVQAASTFGNSVIMVRGHADTYLTLSLFIEAGLNSGALKRSGSKSTGYQYFLNNEPFNITQMPALIQAIDKGEFRNLAPEKNPQMVYQAALNLSYIRAENVKKSLIEYAKAKGLNLDPSQIQASGVGIREPMVPKPQSLEDMARNRRVEFRIIKVGAEAVNKPNFDF